MTQYDWPREGSVVNSPPDRAQLRRDEILRAAEQVFAEKGYHAAGIADVSVTNGNGRGTLVGGLTFEVPPTVTAVSPPSGRGCRASVRANRAEMVFAPACRVHPLRSDRCRVFDRKPER